MTTEERFERIEHFTAGWAEERRKDREEFRMLWRDTQRQLAELIIRIADTNDHLSERIEQLAAESREEDRRLGERIAAVNAAADERGKALDARIEKFLSGLGEWMRTK